MRKYDIFTFYFGDIYIAVRIWFLSDTVYEFHSTRTQNQKKNLRKKYQGITVYVTYVVIFFLLAITTDVRFI